jgi:hypothetical protein
LAVLHLSKKIGHKLFPGDGSRDIDVHQKHFCGIQFKGALFAGWQ